MTGRARVLETVAMAITGLDSGSTARIAIDGVDGAGKTTFADDLGEVVEAAGRPVIRAGVDGFHQPRGLRYQRGRESPEGFYRDSYDLDALREYLLEPLGNGKPFRRAAFDHTTDQPVDALVEEAGRRAVLLFDGLFLHRPELAGYWDLSIFLHADFETTFARMALRDGFDPDPDAPANHRYVAGQRLYIAECSPQERASIVIDNNDPLKPRILRLTAG